MITQKSNHNITPRKTVKVSDAAILFAAVYQTQFWKTLLYKSWKETLLLLARYYFRFNKAIHAMLFWSPIRFRAGSATIGVLAIMFGVSLLLSCNSMDVPILLKPIVAFCVPLVPFFKTQDELYRLVFVDIHSCYLLIYTGLFVVSGFIHLIIVWLGFSNPSQTKRGNSLIVLVLSRWMPVNEFLICGLVEPLLGIGLGLATWHYADDVCFGIFMILISMSEAAQQWLDKAYQMHTQSVLKA
ncbi:hypothetical protein ACSIGC_08105 [Tenacibaculum sp. ZS6-P6]|uniref:hypothetical protein n=1 Tax=Tenacibaculum sp. ZS6-P6 TaxID=3447503 RepID=UPI003F97A8D6